MIRGLKAAGLVGTVSVMAACGAEGGSTGTSALRLDPAPRFVAGRPLAFAPNAGQIDAQVAYVAHGRGVAVLVTHDAVVLKGGGGALRIRPVDANPSPRLEPRGRLRGIENWFVGNDPARWRTKLPTYARVVRRDVWPGIDWVCRGSGDRFEYDFVLAPGADPSRIAVAVEGADALRVDERGDLRIAMGPREIVQHRPVVYEVGRDGPRELEGRCVVGADRLVRFEVAAHDARLPLVIDPTVTYGTFDGGSGQDQLSAIVRDANGGYLYLGGSTVSADFPHLIGFDTTANGGRDAFIGAMHPTGGESDFTTYVGGSGDEAVTALAMDGSDTCWAAGNTTSSDFVTTSDALAPTKGSGSDGFLLQISAGGFQIYESTYLGSNATGDEFVSGIAFDGLSNLYVTGGTVEGFTTTAGVVQTTHEGASDGLDAFVVKLDDGGRHRVWATLLGGVDTDLGTGIAADAANRATVVGATFSADFPVAGAAQGAIGGGEDGFVARLAADAKSLEFATFLGGSATDKANAVVVEPPLVGAKAFPTAGNTVVVGLTKSTDFGATGGFQSTYGGGSFDAFVASYDGSGQVVRTSYLGGAGDDQATGIVRGSDAKYWVCGFTSSTDFPLTASRQVATRGAYDAFVVRLDATVATREGGGLIGGSQDDFGRGVALSHLNVAYVVGSTESADFPVSGNALQFAPGGDEDGFVAASTGAPAAVESFFLPKKVIVKQDPKDPARSKLVVSGFFDMGSAPVDLTRAATLKVGNLSFDVPHLIPANIGISYSYVAPDGLKFAIYPNKAGSSRARFRIDRKGDLAGDVPLNGDLELDFADGTIHARGVVRPTDGRYVLGRKRGALVEPNLFVLKAGASIKGPGKDALSLVVGLATNGTTPAAASDVTVAFGDTFSATIPAGEFTRAGESYVLKHPIAGITKLVLDYLRETITIRGSKLDLGTFAQGGDPVTIVVGVGADARAVAVRAVRKGAALRY